MADSKLSREHSLALLHKLATDDGFRSRYEQKPAAALAELGVPHETIVNLKASCLAAQTLANRDDCPIHGVMQNIWAVGQQGAIRDCKATTVRCKRGSLRSNDYP